MIANCRSRNIVDARQGVMKRVVETIRIATVVVLALAVGAAPALAQVQAPPRSGQVTGDPELPADYVIGPDDVLAIVFWRDEDMTADVIVRPDGKITLPLLNDVQAAGLTPEELRVRVTEEASRLVESPTVMVRVREIKSRKVFITGMVASPGSYPLLGPTFAVQLIAMAGGLLDYANKKNIQIVRTEGSRQVARRFNYNDFQKGENLEQNILLKPGDMVIVP
jgi:polysaccharide export outer membrane protein